MQSMGFLTPWLGGKPWGLLEKAAVVRAYQCFQLRDCYYAPPATIQVDRIQFI